MTRRDFVRTCLASLGLVLMTPVLAMAFDRIPRGYDLILDETGETIIEEDDSGFMYEEEAL